MDEVVHGRVRGSWSRRRTGVKWVCECWWYQERGRKRGVNREDRGSGVRRVEVVLHRSMVAQ